MPGELTIRIQGTEYPFPSFDTLTYKEARFIKKETSLVMGQFFSALENGDPDALIAVALIALRRDSKDLDGLDDMLLTEIEFVQHCSDCDAEMTQAEVKAGPLCAKCAAKAKEEPASPLDVNTPSSDDRTEDEPLSNVARLSAS